MHSGRWMVVAIVGSSMGSAIAQVKDPILPRTPPAFETRNSGGTSNNEVAIGKQEGKPAQITLTAVTESRDWKDATGRVVRARLLAFDDAKGDEANLVRDGKVRLLVDGAKAFSLLSIENLCAEDRAYIGTLAAARKQQAGPKKTTE